jgi:hypothetical protein
MYAVFLARPRLRRGEVSNGSYTNGIGHRVASTGSEQERVVYVNEHYNELSNFV